jgi:hypothetical protein
MKDNEMHDQEDEGTIPTQSGKADTTDLAGNEHYKGMMRKVNAPENHPEQCRMTSEACSKAPYKKGS